MSDTSVDFVTPSALAVEQVLTPSMVGLIARSFGVRPAREVIETRMRTDGGFAAVWLASHSPMVSASVSMMTRIDEQDAGYFVGAAAYALLSAGRDVTESAVRDLAKSAVVWHLGAEYAREQARRDLVGV